MDIEQILSLTKERIGIRTKVRDEYLTFRIKGVLDEIKKEYKLKLDQENFSHVMFLVDYATWAYDNRDVAKQKMPRHLQFRLHNLIVGGGKDV